jgi:uncharacterized protein (TIGR02588 family)
MSDRPESTNQGEPRAGKRQGWTSAERTTFIISVLVILVLAGTAVVEYVNRRPEATATFEVTVDAEQAEQQADSYAVPFSVMNSGGAGAREIIVRFEVASVDSDEVVEELSILIDMLPVRAVEEGVLLIVHDPATHTIRGQVESFLLP